MQVEVRSIRRTINAGILIPERFLGRAIHQIWVKDQIFIVSIHPSIVVIAFIKQVWCCWRIRLSVVNLFLSTFFQVETKIFSFFIAAYAFRTIKIKQLVLIATYAIFPIIERRILRASNWSWAFLNYLNFVSNISFKLWTNPIPCVKIGISGYFFTLISFLAVKSSL